MSDLVDNPEDRISGSAAHMLFCNPGYPSNNLNINKEC